MNKPKPRVVAVVLNWRDAVATRACVTSLRHESTIDAIVVVDNESTGELDALADGMVHVIEHDENLGFARGVNSGIRAALALGADAILAINNDATLGSGSAQLLLEALASGGDSVGMLAPRVLNPDGTPQSTGGRFRALNASTKDLGAGSINYLTWACVLVPRSSLETYGLLDERFFMYWEDVEFGLRLTDNGQKLVLVDDAVAIHAKSQSHARAGAKIDRYSTHGLVLLCLERRGVAKWLGMPFRVAGRLAVRLLSGERLRSTLLGVRDGVRAHRRTPRSAGAL